MRVHFEFTLVSVWYARMRQIVVRIPLKLATVDPVSYVGDRKMVADLAILLDSRCIGFESPKQAPGYVRRNVLLEGRLVQPNSIFSSRHLFPVSVVFALGMLPRTDILWSGIGVCGISTMFGQDGIVYARFAHIGIAADTLNKHGMASVCLIDRIL